MGKLNTIWRQGLQAFLRFKLSSFNLIEICSYTA